jgi:hypothetical protein
VDLATRGWWLCYVPELTVHHHPSAKRDSCCRRWHIVRNRLWFAWLRRPLGSALRRTWRQNRGTSLPYALSSKPSPAFPGYSGSGAWCPAVWRTDCACWSNQPAGPSQARLLSFLLLLLLLVLLLICLQLPRLLVPVFLLLAPRAVSPRTPNERGGRRMSTRVGV